MMILDHAPEIETRRLLLRAPRYADMARVAELANDFDVCSMSSRMPYPYGVDEARAFVEQSEDQDRARENTFVIEEERDGVVGALGFARPAEGPLEIGYWVGRSYWGRGIATEAVKGALQWAKSNWRRKVVAAGHFAENHASAQVLINAGFLYTGEVQRRHSRARGGPAATRMMIWLA
jgi:RimJ/RimL family protein N-acetyltransferase